MYVKGWDRGASAMQAATLATRKRKAEPVRAQLQQRWRDRAQAEGLDTTPTITRSRQPIVLSEGPSTLEIVCRCMRQLEERQLVFSEHALDALALGHSPTHALREEINRTVREALADEGVLRGKPLRIKRLVSLGINCAEKVDRRNCREGDLVVFNQNLKNYRLEKRDPDGDRVRLRPGDAAASRRQAALDPPAELNPLQADVYETRPIEIRKGDRIRWSSPMPAAIPAADALAASRELLGAWDGSPTLLFKGRMRETSCAHARSAATQRLVGDRGRELVTRVSTPGLRRPWTEPRGSDDRECVPCRPRLS